MLALLYADDGVVIEARIISCLPLHTWLTSDMSTCQLDALSVHFPRATSLLSEVIPVLYLLLRVVLALSSYFPRRGLCGSGVRYF